MANHAISTPAVRPGFGWVPATIGRPDSTQTVLVECPTAWCTVDHLEIREVAVEDITHYGPGTFFGVPDMSDDSTDMHEMYVNITADPAHGDPRMRAAHLVVANGHPEDAHLTVEQGYELADALVRTAAEIRQALRTCERSNQLAAVDSDPDMDEALRRVRGGAA